MIGWPTGAYSSTAGLIFTVEFKNLLSVMNKMDGKTVEEKMENFYKKCGPILKNKLVYRAPIESGALKGSIALRYGDNYVEAWSGQSNPRTGFPYAAALASGSYRHAHGPFTGSPTTNYHERAGKDALPLIQKEAQFMVEQIANALV